jgi:type IV conjugative transfer system protein TraL
MEQVTIPQYVDELMQIGFWEIDEAMFMVLGTFIGIMTGWMFSGMFVGAFMASMFAKYKNGKNRGMLLHFFYWYGAVPFKGLWCDNALKRFWIN